MASRTARAVYTQQMSLYLDPGQVARIAVEAERHGMSKSEVGRLYLEAGLVEGKRPTVTPRVRRAGVKLADAALVVSVEPSTAAALDTFAGAAGVSRSAIARAAINAGMAVADAS
jgi:hypothetical protein